MSRRCSNAGSRGRGDRVATRRDSRRRHGLFGRPDARGDAQGIALVLRLSAGVRAVGRLPGAGGILRVHRPGFLRHDRVRAAISSRTTGSCCSRISGSCLLLTLPFITMRLFAEERKLGTIELLYTYPLRDGEILGGKYLASVAIFIMMLALTLLYPILHLQHPLVSAVPAVRRLPRPAADRMRVHRMRRCSSRRCARAR